MSKVRQLIREHQLAAAVPAPGAGQRVPAALIQDGLVVKGVPGVLTVLHDGGYDDRECIAWMFTDSDLPGRPIDALRDREPALLGQTVVVIGGSAGIGFETARGVRAEGANIILTGRTAERLQQASTELGALSTAAFDANDPALLESFCATTYAVPPCLK